MSTGGYIYAIGMEGTAHVKTGCTTGSVEQRRKSLQTGQPFPLQVLASMPVDSHLRRVERTIHGFLEDERKQGEWFAVAVDQEKLEALIVRAVQYLQEEADRKAQELDLRYIAGQDRLCDSNRAKMVVKQFERRWVDALFRLIAPLMS